MQKKISFDTALPSSQPIAFGALTDAQFNELMEQSFAEYKRGETISAQDIGANILKKEKEDINGGE